MLAEVIVQRKSKSVQVDSLPSPDKSLSPQSPLLQENQSSLLSPNAALPSKHPSASYKLEFQAPSCHMQTSSDTSTEFVHMFATPNEIVKEELKGIEMNKTLHSLNLHKNYESAGFSSANVCEESKCEKSFGHAEGKDDREASLLHEQQVIQTLDETGRRDIRELERSGYSSPQKFVNDQLNSVQFVSSVPNEISRNYDGMTIDKLCEEFCSGKISLEDFYQKSITIPKEEEMKEYLLPQMKKKGIQILEQQVLEAAQSISESQHLASRVRLLLDDTKTHKEDRLPAQSHRSCEKFSNNSSHRQYNDMAVAGTSRDNLPWQKALSVYRKQGKLDTLIHFLDAVDFENITSDMVDEIIECENNIQSKKVQKNSVCKNIDDNTVINEKRINRNFLANKNQSPVRDASLFSNMDAKYEDAVKKGTHSLDGSELTGMEEWQKSLLSGSESPELHLNLTLDRLV